MDIIVKIRICSCGSLTEKLFLKLVIKPAKSNLSFVHILPDFEKNFSTDNKIANSALHIIFHT